ncbi:tail length tape-measure protein T [Staphylococcus phage PT1-1]
MNNAVQNGGKELQGFASIAGKSGTEFAQIWKSDPYRAVQLFEEGLAKQNKEGHNVKAMLKELGITELRETDTVLRLANGNEQLALARRNANKGWSEGNALSKEAETKYKTLGNQMKIFMNHVRDLGIELGATLAPVLIGVMKVLTPMIDALAKAPTPVKGLVIALALIPVAAVPVLASLAAITGSMGLVGQAMNTASKGAMANSRSMRIYATSMGLLTNPIKTTGSALQSLAGRMRGTGKASKVLKNDMVASSVGMVTAGKNAGTAGGFFSKFGGKLKWVASLGGLLTPIISGLGAVIAAIGAPILIAVGAVTALVGAFVLAYKKVDWFREGIDGLVYTFKVFGGGIINTVGNALKWLGEKFGWLGGTAVKKSTSALKEWSKSLPSASNLKIAVAGLSMLKSGFKSVMGVLASAKDKATDTSDALGKGVSKGTRQALGHFVKYSEDSDKILAQIKNNHGKITEKERLALNQIQDKMTADLLDKLNQRAAKQKAIQEKVFSQNSGLSAKREQEIMNRTTKQFDTSKQRLIEISAEIKRLVDKQARDGKLDAKEMQELNKLYDEQRKLAVGTLASTTKEQDRILSQMSINRKAYSMQEAQDIIQGGIKARDAAKKEAKKRYDQEVDNINQMVGLSEDEKQKMLANAKKRYDEEVQEADKKHNKIISGVKKNNGNIENEMDLSNGRVYSNAEKWWRDIANISKQSFINGWNTGQTIYAALDVWGRNMAQGLSNWGESFRANGAKLWSKVKEGWDSAVQTTGDIWNSIKTKGENIGPWFSQKGSQFWSNLKTSWNNAVKTTGDIWAVIKTTGSNIGAWFTQKGRQFWGFLKTGWTQSLTTAGVLWTLLIGWLGRTFSGIGTWFVARGKQAWSFLKTGWVQSITGAGILWSLFISKLGQTFGTIGTWFANKGKQAWTFLKNGWSTSIAGASILWTWLLNKLGAAWATVKAWFIAKGRAMGQAVATGWKLVSNTVVNVFRIMWNTAKNIWTIMWNFIKNIAFRIGSYISSRWTLIKNITVTAWLSVKNTISKFFTAAWNIVKNVAGWIWNKIKTVWGWLRNITSTTWNYIRNTINKWLTSAFNVVRNITRKMWDTVKNTWNWIKDHIIRRLGNILSNIRNFFGKMWEAVKYRMDLIWNKIKRGWNNIKNYIGDMANRAKNAVVNRFRDMYNGAKRWVDNIGSYIDKAKSWMKSKALKLGKSVANGAIGGLNKMIGGINKISKAITSKNLMKTIPYLSTGTTAPNGVPVNRDGQLKQSTAAIVNDKGPGNGTGARGYQELIQRKNGDIHAPKGRNVLVGLNKGDSVINGKNTQELRKRGMIPKFSTGTKNVRITNTEDIPHFNLGSTIKDMFPGSKKKKKKKHKHQSALETLKEAGTDAAGVVGDTVENIMGGIKGVTDDVMDFFDNPKGLVDKVMKVMGVGGFGKANKTMEMAGMAYAKLKKMLNDKVREWFDENAGGDGGYIDLSKGINFKFYASGAAARAAGYPFARPHHGIDVNYPYGSKLYSTLSGIATAKSGYNGGFGNSMWIKAAGGIEAIYGHMSKLAFSGSKRVKPGSYLGLSGGDPRRQGASAGDSTGPHLHYEMRWNGVPKDPIPWLKKNNGGGKGGATGSGASYTRSVIKKAQRILGGRYMNSSITDNMMRLAKRESNYDPNAVNNWDINAQRGTPSKGLFQMIAPTFRANAKAGYTNFNNPIHQAISAMQYIVRRYGWGGFPRAAAYAYENGGLVRQHQIAEIGEGNKPEMVIPLTKKARAMQLIEQAKQFMGIKDPEIEYDKEININNSNSNNSSSNQLLQQLIQAQEHTNILLAQLLTSNQNIENKSWVFDEDSIKKLHNKHQDERERKEKRANMYRGGRTI